VDTLNKLFLHEKICEAAGDTNKIIDRLINRAPKEVNKENQKQSIVEAGLNYNKQDEIPNWYFVGSKNIRIFDHESHSLLNKISHGIRNIERNFSKCLLTSNHDLYITGSYQPPENSTYKFDPKEGKLEKKKRMLSGRYCHAFTEVNSKYLIVTGGSTQKCEIYNIQKNLWTLISDMKELRTNHISIAFGGYVVYSFGGTNRALKPLSSYEKLLLGGDLSRCTNNWELIKLRISPHEFPLFRQGYFHIEGSEYLLFGGKNKDCSDNKCCIRFNAQTEEMVNTNSNHRCRILADGTSYTFTSVVSQRKKWYMISKVDGSLHVFNRCKWIRITNFVNTNE